VFPGVEPREVVLVYLATPVDCRDVEHFAMTRAWFVHVGPQVPRAGFMDDNLGEWFRFQFALALRGFGGGLIGGGSRGRSKADPFGKCRSYRCDDPTRQSWHRSLQNGDGRGTTLWSRSCHALGVPRVLGRELQAFPSRVVKDDNTRGGRGMASSWQRGVLNGSQRMCPLRIDQDRDARG
jgi:hypothetical protein